MSRGWLFPLRLAFVLLLVLQAALPYRPALPAPETLADSDAELISTAAPPAAANLDLNLDLNLNLDLFTGQRLEQRLGTPEGGLDRGLYFYGLRWYDSSLGRFIQADTIVPQPGIRRVGAQRPASCSNLILEDLAGPGGCDRIGPDKDVMVDALLVGGLSLELSEGSA